MRIRPILMTLFSAALGHVLAATSAVPSTAPVSSATSAPPAPFAVVELFTSEGCSSCPPADRLLSELAAQAEKEGKPVYALSFHVDYWNHLGWDDPFSRPEFSRRQQRYSESLDGRVYTPQMIVNGSDEFVGSQGSRARGSIAKALQGSAGAAIALSLDPVKAREGGKGGVDGKGGEGPLDAGTGLDVSYRVTGQGEGDLLHLALVEKGLSVPVKRGENGGRTLRHDNVVRMFRTVRLDAKGEGRARLDMPAGLRRDKALLIAYVQKAATLKTIGAAKMALVLSGS